MPVANTRVYQAKTQVNISTPIQSTHLTCMGRHQGMLGGILSPFIWAFVAILFIFGMVFFGREWYDSLIVRLDQGKAVHPDQSISDTGISSQVKPQITIFYKNIDGKEVAVLADAEAYSEFVKQNISSLTEIKGRLLIQTRNQLQEGLNEIFNGVRERVDRFADWYFGYTTAYKILWKATTSATGHAFSFGSTASLNDVVSYDVEKYLHQHYEEIVLRPEITDSQLQNLYEQVLTNAHENYVNALTMLHTNFIAFIASQTTHVEAPDLSRATLKLDWHSQFKKVNFSDYQKGAEEAMMGGGLALGGAAAGKAVGGAVGKGIAGKTLGSAAMSGVASKGLLSKMAAPFVSKAVAASAGGAVGSVGGPLGALAGVVGGLSIDYAINEGVEMNQRGTFIQDVNTALDTTQGEWEKVMGNSLDNAVRVWMEDAIQLLPDYEDHV